jgi:hypothetical protein
MPNRVCAADGYVGAELLADRLVVSPEFQQLCKCRVSEGLCWFLVRQPTPGERVGGDSQRLAIQYLAGTFWNYILVTMELVSVGEYGLASVLAHSRNLHFTRLCPVDSLVQTLQPPHAPTRHDDHSRGAGADRAAEPSLVHLPSDPTQPNLLILPQCTLSCE